MLSPCYNYAVMMKPAYTLDEIAEVLSVSRAYVNQLVRDGKLRVARIGHRTIRVSHEALTDFLREHEGSRPDRRER
jgi:excisionase family DNA binding protein